MKRLFTIIFILFIVMASTLISGEDNNILSINTAADEQIYNNYNDDFASSESDEISSYSIKEMALVGDGFVSRESLPTDARSTITQYNPKYNPYTDFNIGNCTWYAFGRAWEILGYYPQDLVFQGDAEVWYAKNKANYDSGKGGFPYSSDINAPALGAIAVWENTSNAYGSGGHVAVVESISNNNDGTKILKTSDSGYASYYFGIWTNYTSNPRLGMLSKYKFLGYIYILGNQNSSSSGYDPQGCLDYCSSDAPGTITVRGWAFDRDASDKSIYVHVYVGGPAGTADAFLYIDSTSVYRQDVNVAYGLSGNHGFEYVIHVPNVGSHPVYVYAINEGGSNNPLIDTRNVNIVAPPKDVQISFDLNGGTINGERSISSVIGTVGTGNYNDLSWMVPVYTGLKFRGWFDKDGVQVYSEDGHVTNDGKYFASNSLVYGDPFTLYAHWDFDDKNPVDVKIDFDLNGGNIDGETGQITCIGTLGTGNYWDVSFMIPSLRGYCFLGWYDSNGVQVYSAEGTVTNEGKYFSNNQLKTNKDFTVYAKWEIDKSNYTEVKIYMDLNGGTLPGYFGYESEVWDRYIVASVGSPTHNDIYGAFAEKEGCTFLGWYDDEGVAVYDKDGHLVNENKYFSDEGIMIYPYDFVIHARWEAQNPEPSMPEPGITPTPSVSSLPIDEDHFPDSYFRGYVRSKFDLDGDDLLSSDEICSVTRIEVGYSALSSLKGIEYFYNLNYLECYELEQLKSLDLSKNTSLLELYCQSNNISKLDLSHNNNLRVINCSGNVISSLNVSDCLMLEILNCSNNTLKSLNLENNTKLKTLMCSSNGLESLNISSNNLIETVKCDHNAIKYLNLNNNPRLAILRCGRNQMTTLYIEKLYNLQVLSCWGNSLTSVDLSQCTKLETLEIDETNISKLDISDNKELQHLSCTRNQFNELDISCCPLLLTAYKDGIKQDVSGYIRYEYEMNDGSVFRSYYIECDKNVNILAEPRDSITPTSTAIDDLSPSVKPTENIEQTPSSAGNHTQTTVPSEPTASPQTTATPAKKSSATFVISPDKVKFGKNTTVQIISNSGAKLTVVGTNSKASNKKYVSIKNGKKAKLVFYKKAIKGKYKFMIISPAKGNFEFTSKKFTVLVK